jgi:hypothetical protein
MILYHVLSKVAYEHLQTKQRITGDGRRICWQSFKPAYRWMIDQMLAKGIQRPKDAGNYPVWAWYKFNGKSRPNMRYLNPKKEALALLELEVPDEQVLLSDYIAWHSVLNYSYVASSEAEWDQYHADKVSRESTWPRIFDLDVSYDPEYKGPLGDIQAVFWTLRLDMVRRVWKYRWKPNYKNTWGYPGEY